MNIAESEANRKLVARVESLERQLKDLTRRVDDISDSLREKSDKKPLSLKHG